MAQPLQQHLELIPESNRSCLDQELIDNGHQTTIANSIIDWPIVAGYIPGITNTDVEDIRQNDPFSLQLQRYGKYIYLEVIALRYTPPDGLVLLLHTFYLECEITIKNLCETAHSVLSPA